MFPREYLTELEQEKAEESSQARFDARLDNYKRKRTILPRTIHAFWWFVHNAIAHPFIAIAPIKPFFDFHDYTGKKLSLEGK